MATSPALRSGLGTAEDIGRLENDHDHDQDIGRLKSILIHSSCFWKDNKLLGLKQQQIRHIIHISIKSYLPTLVLFHLQRLEREYIYNMSLRGNVFLLHQDIFETISKGANIFVYRIISDYC